MPDLSIFGHKWEKLFDSNSGDSTKDSVQYGLLHRYGASQVKQPTDQTKQNNLKDGNKIKVHNVARK